MSDQSGHYWSDDKAGPERILSDDESYSRTLLNSFLEEQEKPIEELLKDEIAREYKAWFEGWVQKIIHGEDTGEPRGILNDGLVGVSYKYEPQLISNDYLGGHFILDGFVRDRGVEWSQTPTSADKRTMDLPSPVHRWSGSVGLCRDGCDGPLFTKLLLENHGAGVRTDRPA